MASITNYKQYNRRERRAVLEADFSKGMMSTDGAVEDGYLKFLVNCAYEKETASIVPRPGLRLSKTIFPSTAVDPGSAFLSSNLNIKAVKQCVENGITYDQIIICETDDNDPNQGTIWVLTAENFLSHVGLEFTDDYEGDVSFADYISSTTSHVCYLYSTHSPSIHDVYFHDDSYNRIEFPVGEFAFGNSYYFMGEDSLGNPGLFRTFFDDTQTPPRYEFERVTPKTLTVSEAVTYGYNMLLGSTAYTFEDKHSASQLQFEGILPYEVSVVNGEHQYTSLMMLPKKNQPVDLRCYYDDPGSTAYDIVWETRETTAADWTEIQRNNNITLASGVELTLDNFNPQNKEIMIRVVAYTAGSEDVVKAIVVGFDFTEENRGSAKDLQPEVYDLTTATGMECWKGRDVVWGLPKDPTILFLSDYNEPAYFPYPNNIVVFNEPIIYCVEFMDSLAVFTTDKLYQVTLDTDGNSWKTTVLQSHLSIDAWDKHLIQTVRNMLYFKSGNYYYMMVPKAQSTTGELTLAPITTPITSFFDRFSVNVEQIIRQTYPSSELSDISDLELLTYYNYLDYEDVHNIYAYRFNSTQAILHFDVIYNTSDRTWKIWVFEASNFIFPYRQEATRLGLLATTSTVTVQDVSAGVPYPESVERIVQVFCWDKMLVRSCYVHSDAKLLYNPDNATASVDSYVLTINSDFASISNHTLVFVSDLYAYIDDHTLYAQDSDDFYVGYSKVNILQAVKTVFDSQDEYYTFKNYQFIDSGYRRDELHYKKRYREIQLLINNLDKKSMQFGMDYILDGSPRKIFYKYDVTQTIDELDSDYGIVYIDSTPYLETELEDIDLTNQWSIDQDLTPEVTLWKIRVAVSGKGYAPRLRLYTRNEKRYELLGINWVSKIMHMR